MITSLFVVDKQLGPQDESTFENHKNLKELLKSDADAGLEIDAGMYNLIIRDTLDSLMSGLCIQAVLTLEQGSSYTLESKVGYSATVIAAVDDMAEFTCEGKTISMPIGLAIQSLRMQAGRFGELLKRVYPDNAMRAKPFLDFAGIK